LLPLPQGVRGDPRPPCERGDVQCRSHLFRPCPRA
jgi:hypothetical protein